MEARELTCKFIKLSVFILDVEVFTLVVNSKASQFVTPKVTCNC